MSQEGVSERGRELAVRAVKEADDKVLEDLRQRLFARIDEIGRFEAEVAELRSHVEALDIALRASGERREAAERANAELRENNERLEKEVDIGRHNINECVRAWDELRERVGELEKALREVRQPLQDIVDECGAEGSWPEIEAIEKIDAALSQANAQGEPESEEEN